MTSNIDICNRALDDITADGTITSFAETSKEAQVCSRWYDKRRKALLRSAPWGFARRQISLTLLGSLTDDTSIQPWAFKYLYPSNCVKVRYLLPPRLSAVDNAVLTGDYFASCAGSYRGSPFKVANEQAGVGSRKVILSNLQNAVAVFIFDETTVDLFDPDFEEALVAVMAASICMPITGSMERTKLKIAQAEGMIDKARANDANESMPTTDHTPDWIIARGDGGYANNIWLPGAYYGWDDMNWAM